MISGQLRNYLLSGMSAPALLHAGLLLDLPLKSCFKYTQRLGGACEVGVGWAGVPPVKYSKYRADVGGKFCTVQKEFPFHFLMGHTRGR